MSNKLFIGVDKKSKHTPMGCTVIAYKDGIECKRTKVIARQRNEMLIQLAVLIKDKPAGDWAVHVACHAGDEVKCFIADLQKLLMSKNYLSVVRARPGQF